MDQRQQLRLQMRRARRALSPLQQKRAAKSLLNQLLQLPTFTQAQHIAVYLAADGEIDTQYVIEKCWQLGKTIYLPILHPVRHNRLWFARYKQDSAMIKNCYGISEPDPHRNARRQAWALDLVLLPLVAFDSQGGRMGMGGGYYDRTFAFTAQRQGKLSPKLIGLAHEIQKVDQLPVESWDIPLAGIVTNQHRYIAR